MKKQIVFSLALIAALFTVTSTAFAQEARPAKKADKKEKPKKAYKERSDDNSSYSSWNTSGWGGERVVGTGDVVTEDRDLRDFSGVSSAISADIDLRQSATFKVSIDGQKNILDVLETVVTDGKLKIAFKKGYSLKYKKALKIRVDAPNFAYLGMAGSGNVTSDGALSGEKLDVFISGSGDFNLMQLQYSDVKVSISGSGDMNIGGSAERAELTISGSGDLKARELRAQSVRCRVSGSGDIACSAAKELDALISGSGDISYSGNPASVKKKVSGSGSIESK